MKQKCGILCVLAIAFFTCVEASFAVDEYESFNGLPFTGWDIQESYLTNATVAGANAVAIPGSADGTVLSNGVANLSGKVWTDFWTIPNAYSYGALAAPAIDATATAQFFVNTNGYWVAFSGNGAGGYITNILTTVLSGTNTAYPYGTNTSYSRVSVLSDYDTLKYSFFVNDKCLGTNLTFISDPSVDNTHWFQVKNLATLADRVCLLDEYLLTNRLSSVLTNPITGGGISQSDSMYYFGTISPRPAATNAGLSGTAVTWQLDALGNPNDVYLVKGGTTTSSFPNVIVDAPLVDGGLTTDLGGNSKYFYQVIRKSVLDNAVTITNTEVYAAYKQTRERYRSYLVGVPVTPLGSDMTLAGPIGTQLAKGLAAGDKLTVFVGGAAKVFTRDAGLSWSTFSGGTAPGALTFTPGMGVLIQAAGVAADRTTLLAGLLQTNTTSVLLANGSWNIVAWPYESSGTLGAAVGGVHTPNDTVAGYLSGDYAWIQQQGSINPIQARYITGGWVQYFNRINGTDLDGLTLQAGDGIMIKPAGVGLTWVPAQ
jgi:hypothetical protein